jgi:hypothetical protein
VIVVDNGSTDRTAEVAGRRAQWFRSLAQARLCLCGGMAVAEGEVLALDGDGGLLMSCTRWRRRGEADLVDRACAEWGCYAHQRFGNLLLPGCFEGALAEEMTDLGLSRNSARTAVGTEDAGEDVAGLWR